jgi:exonuclease VII small subunit
MNGRIEAAQEQLEQAAFKWQKSLRWRGKLDRALTEVEKELDQAITRLGKEMDEYLKEKGSIPR